MMEHWPTKDILIQSGVISDIQDELPNQQANIIHAKGFLLAPGFIDLHVHLREPGGEHKETIETGTKGCCKRWVYYCSCYAEYNDLFQIAAETINVR